MKFFLKYCLILLIGFCYLNSVFELDSNECKQNYGKETHSYLSSFTTTDESGVHAEKTVEILTTVSALFLYKSYTEQPPLFSFLVEPSPPDKIYLRYRSLLI